MVGPSLIHRSFSEPDRPKRSWEETWQGPDHGLIKCWETGRDLASQDPDLAARCKAGALPPLHWKGGVARELKKKEKFGALSYLAQWQGLRGQDLEIDQGAEVTLTCTAIGMVVTFTPDLTKLAEPQSSEDEGESNG
ncbi:hypothetical protein PCA10_07150 [Metapseudomonas resinovorans NBRC 106553]|uniref:Uncharacterized protein n=2 Tax=Metapseudomonas resinovorans TaxID=53412 RepID=S6ACI4_METRE|nr:hypothetical protein [Pseudomonas resinovorans]BAN46447.1 hypothetical protein PCA10_07150 [Pseudomonas resinovorans NBRC 106553]